MEFNIDYEYKSGGKDFNIAFHQAGLAAHIASLDFSEIKSITITERVV